MKKNYLLPIVLVCLFSLTSLAQTTWDGSDSADWHTAANWDTNSIPTSTDNVIIADAGTAPIISSGTLAQTLNLTLLTGATLTINSANSLTVSGNLTITDNDSFILNSGSSLIVSGTSSGDLKYLRNITTTDKWYLVSSPVVGENELDFLTNSGDEVGFIPLGGVGGAQNAIGLYSGGWSYNTANFGSGYGFTVKTSKPGDLVFTGQMPTSDYGAFTTDTTDDFNLFGNPYPSYIPANLNADATNNFLTVNTDTASRQDELDSATIWFWDQATDGYIQINQGSPARFIAPSQGFFIKNKGGFGDSKIDFKESMQSHQSTEVFNKSVTTRQDIKLFLSDGTKNKYTEIYYIDGTTTGFDNGYDSSIFGGVTQEFAVYTEAVANGTGKKLGIQSLPNSELENMIIPVGVISDAGAVSFSVNASNLPQGYKVFLEDKDTGNFIRLDEAGSKYDVTFDNAVQGIGRFFLHTTTSALSTGSFDATNVSAYISEKNNLKIVGIQSGTTQVRLFNILGKQVLNTSFQSKGVDNVILPNVRTGVYIVQIVSEQGTINKKIVIE